MINETGPFADMAVNGKYPMDQLPKIVNIVKGYKGAVAGLDESNYFIFRNHWGCRHVFIPTRYTDSDRGDMAEKSKIAEPPSDENNRSSKKKSKNLNFDSDKDVKDIYGDILDVPVNKGVFKLLTEDVPLKVIKNPTKDDYAHYDPIAKTVWIPLDDRRKNSKWWAEAVVYHEYGHAIDDQRDLKNSQEIKDMMNKYASTLDLKSINKKIMKLNKKSVGKNHNLYEQSIAILDTLWALNTDYGDTRDFFYGIISGNREKEFIAHAFENSFKGNSLFQKHLPELYKEMIDFVNNIKPI